MAEKIVCRRVSVDPQFIARLSEEFAAGQAVWQRQAEVFKALGNPLRVAVIELLERHGRLCVCDISDASRTALSAVSRHMHVLQWAGLVTGTREGPTIWYSLTPLGRRILGMMREGG